MRKNIFAKIWFMALAALLACTCMAMAACGDEPTATAAPKLELSASELTLWAGESSQLTATLENSQEEIEWKTADATVATVADGLITAIAKGTTTVTATAGELTAECTVTVLDQSAPVLSVDYEELNIVKGKSFTVTASVTWNGIAENPEFAWQCESDKVSIEPSGGSVNITALATGEAELTVSATVRGVPVSRTVRVTVIPVDVAFDIANIDKTLGRYELTLFAEDVLTPEITVSVDGEVDSEAELTWSVTEGQNSVSVDSASGEITALIAGSATVSATYTADAGDSVSVNVYVTVKGIEKTLEKQTLDFAYDAQGVHTQSFDIDLKQSGLTAADITGATLCGTDIDTADFAVSGEGVLTVPATALAGVYGEDKELKIYFTKYEFGVSVTLVTKTVSDEASFLAIGEIAKALGGNGYYVLSENIALTTPIASGRWSADGIELTEDHRIGADTPFSGTIDGRGHSVSNMQIVTGQSGWIQNMGAGSVLKNIAIRSLQVNQSCGLIYGGNDSVNATVKDVFVQVSNLPIKGNHHASVFGVDLLNAFALDNVAVDYTAVAEYLDGVDPETEQYGNYMKVFGCPKNCTAENVALLGVSKNFAAHIIRSGASADGTAEGIYVSFADGTSNGVPIPSAAWSDELKAFLPEDNFAFEPSEIKASQGVEAKFALGGLSAYYEYTLDADAKDQGIEFANGAISVPAAAAIGDYVLTATPVFGGDSKQLTLKLMHSVITELASKQINLQFEAAGNALHAASGNFTVELEAAGGGTLGELQSVTVGGNVLDTTAITLSGSTLTIPYASFGNVYGTQKVTVATQSADTLYAFNFDALFVSVNATTKEQFLSFGAVSKLLGSGGYFTLGGDIDLENTNVCEYDGTDKVFTIDYRLGVAAPFVGTIDGCGHTVSNMSSLFSGGRGNWGWIEKTGNGAVLKNIAITNFTYSGNCGLIYGNPSNLAVTGNTITVENVYVATGGSVAQMSWGHSSIFGGGDAMRNATFKNVVVDYSVRAPHINSITANDKALGNFVDCTLTNVAIIGVPEAMKSAVLRTGTPLAQSNGSEQGVYAGYTDGTNNGAATPTGWSNELLALLPADRTFTFAESNAEIAAGASYTVSNLSRYYKYELSEQAIEAGIQWANGRISVADNTAAGNYTLTATPIFGGDAQTLSFAVPVTVKSAAQKANLQLSVNDGAIAYSDCTFTMELTGASGEVQSVTVDGNPISLDGVTLSDTTLTVPLRLFGNAYGVKPMSVVTQGDTKCYFTFDILLVSVEATTKEQFLSFGAVSKLLGNGGYFTLGGNIDLEKTNMYSATAENDYRLGVAAPFVGTVDGCGYTVSNMTVTGNNYGWIQKMGNGSVLKNIAINNFVYDANCSLTYGNNNGGGATIENVYVKVGTPYNTWGYSAIFGSSDVVKEAKLKNVVVDFSAIAATMNTCATNANKSPERQKALGYFNDCTFENVAVFGICDNYKEWVMCIGTNTTRVNGSEQGVYAGYTDGTNNGVTFPASGWDEEYWTVSGNTVTWKEKTSA